MPNIQKRQIFCKSKKLEVTVNCYAIVSEMFANFQNPENIGKNFSWDKFPEMAAIRCRNGIFLHMNIPTEMKEQIETYAKIIGQDIGNNLVNAMQH